MWKDSWWLVGKELKLQRLAFVSTILVTFLLSFFASLAFIPFLEQAVTPQGFDYPKRFVLDLIFVGLTPTFSAIYMSSPYLSFRSFKEDPFGKRMAVYRALPVPVEVLARSRMLLMLVTLVSLSIVFYTTMIILASLVILQTLPFTDIIIFILIWFGYAIAAGGLNTFIECGTNGKVLWLFPTIFLTLFVVIAIMTYNTTGIGIVEWSFSLAQRHGWLAAAASLLLGAVCSFATYKILKTRLRVRDYV